VFCHLDQNQQGAVRWMVDVFAAFASFLGVVWLLSRAFWFDIPGTVLLLLPPIYGVGVGLRYAVARRYSFP
jgi:hypothetical protein